MKCRMMWHHNEMRCARSTHLSATRVIVVAALLLGALQGCGRTATDFDLFPSLSDEGAASDSEAAVAESGMAAVRVSDLPPEALATLRLIEKNGPFPYPQDGTVFHNYEGILPEMKDGYYHEYTVATPGASDRGARRIVTGADDERYYTDDHYDSFRLVME